jgi:hypothetical protein
VNVGVRFDDGIDARFDTLIERIDRLVVAGASFKIEAVFHAAE